MSEPIQTPLVPVDFALMTPHGLIEWRVTMQEDGSLTVHSTSRRTAKMLVMPRTDTSATITNVPIVKRLP